MCHEKEELMFFCRLNWALMVSYETPGVCLRTRAVANARSHASTLCTCSPVRKRACKPTQANRIAHRFNCALMDLFHFDIAVDTGQTIEKFFLCGNFSITLCAAVMFKAFKKNNTVLSFRINLKWSHYKVRICLKKEKIIFSSFWVIFVHPIICKLKSKNQKLIFD